MSVIRRIQTGDSFGGTGRKLISDYSCSTDSHEFRKKIVN